MVTIQLQIGQIYFHHNRFSALFYLQRPSVSVQIGNEKVFLGSSKKNYSLYPQVTNGNSGEDLLLIGKINKKETFFL